MKTKFKSKLLSILLVLVMVLALVPVSALTAFAAEPTEITEIKSVISVEHVPKAGMEVDLFMPNVPDGEPYSRPWSGAEWYDSNGVKIAPTVNHHYDLGYEFEAGHTYYADYQYTASDGYVFAQNPTITLTGPDPSMFTYEIIDRWDNNEAVTVRYTFTIPGEFENADINKVSMQYYGTPKDGGKKPDRCNVIYNNCTITSEEWNTGTWGSNASWGTYTGDGSNAPTFLAGETYVHMIELTAKDGYKFSAGLHVQKGTQDAEEYGVVSLSADRTVATVKFTYEIPSVEIINTIELVAANQHMNFCLRSGESIYLPQPFVPKYVFSADCPYEVENVNSCDWINDETGKYLELGYPQTFENAKKYTLRFHVRIKDEFETTHKFASGTDLGLNVTDYAYANSSFVDFKVSGGGTTATVEVTFTVQFPEGAGSSAGNPAYCYSYEEFKYAMESPDIRFVALGDVDDIITKVEGDGLIPAISVNGIKHLNVIGNATFTAPANDDGYKTICALLHTEQGDTLTVSGAGKLKFRAVANNSYNAVIYNQGGSVIIDSNGALIGSYNTAVYGKAIWQEYGDLRISGGQLFAENALAPGSLPQSHSAVYIKGGKAWISGGTFKTENKIDTIDLPYGLDIGQYATVDLSGGTFYGILLPQSSTPLANYMDEELYTPLSDGSRFNPESEYSQNYTASGKVVRIAWLIDHVDVHINAPIAGVDISENYFNIPTSGCKVTMYYPQWYKNGEPVTYGTFEAGASYKVVVWVDAKADYGAEFSNGVTVAINNQSVAVDRKSSHLIAVEYDFGECPNIVPQVDLTVTAPKEGNTPSYTIGCGSDAYYAVGGSSNYTEYRKWYMSSDNDDWWEINGSHQFMAGYYYKLVVDIRTNNGYEFPLIDVGTIQPDVTATVNGYSANVIKAYDQDPSRYITVEYNFGECNDSVVENIIIENVTAPVAGEKPNYNWSIRGSGYQMNTAKNAYYDVYWKNPPEQWYYVKNGLQWWDTTSGSWEYVYENDSFIAGHTYVCQLYLVVEDGYTFRNMTTHSALPTATINGNTAEINEGWTTATEARVYYTFTCEAKEITTIMLYDLDLPVGGNVPDTSVTPAYPEYYVVESVKWFDIEDNPAGAVFESGVPYYALITVAPASGVVFADSANMTAYIDGSILPGVEVENNKVIIPVIIRKPASAPIVNPYVFTTQPTGGTVNAGESLNVAWQTSFIPTSTEIQYWDGEAWDQWDIQQAQSAVDSYDFVNADVASYRFRLVTYIGSDVVATSNEFVINWAGVAQEYIYVYTAGEGNGSNDSNCVTEGTQITLYTPEYLGFSPINGFTFDYWSIRVGTAQSAEVAQKQPGETIIINDNTYIIAIWKEAPVNKYTVAYGIGEGSGSADFETDIAFGSSFTLKAFGDVGIIAPEGKMFDYWSVRTGSAMGTEMAQKQPGDTIIINDNTYIIAMWKDIPHTCVGVAENGQSATCTVNGWKDYYRCECGKYYEDADCQISIPDLDAWKVGAGKIAASHNYGTLIPATPEKHTQTELVAGVAAHYKCSVCDKYFTFGKVETTLQELTGATPSHSYGAWQTNDDKHWKECSCGLKSEENDHVYDNATDVTCNTCDHDRTLPHTHGNGVKQLGQSATCTAPGWNDYYKCSCGKFYTEAACTNEITDLAAWKTGAGKIEASHNYGTLVSAVTEKHTQTELVAGVAAHYHCSACGKYFTEGKVETTLEALTGTTPSHSYGDWKTDADKHWKECSCGKKADEGNHVDANSNNKCDTCDKTLSGGVTPPPHTHDYGTTWKSDGTNHWKECSCGDMKEVTAHSGGTATCTAKAKCSECNTEYGELAEHKYSEATCTAKAKCSVCGDEKGELAAHTYVDGKCACGATDPNYVPPHEHNFIEGKCECGETDPNYTPGTDTPGTDVPGTDVPGTDKPEDPDDGLSGGAIAGIVAGSVVVLGGGGFALWWFVFRKKKLF